MEKLFCPRARDFRTANRRNCQHRYQTYEAGGFKFAIAQAEVTDLLQLSDYLEPLTKALDELKDPAWTRLCHAVHHRHRARLQPLDHLLPAPPILDDLPYPPLPDGTRDAPGVVSRKKQLLPLVLGLLES